MFKFRVLVNFPTRVESELLHVRDHGYKVRDFSITLDVQEHAKTFTQVVVINIFYRLFQNRIVNNLNKTNNTDSVTHDT